MIYKWRHVSMWELIHATQPLHPDWQQIKARIVFVSLALVSDHNLCVNASWHICLTCQLLEPLCNNSNCKGIITIKVNICSIWMWLLHLHALDLRLHGNVLRLGFVSNLLDMSNHNKWILHLIVMAMAIEKNGSHGNKWRCSHCTNNSKEKFL